MKQVKFEHLKQYSENIQYVNVKNKTNMKVFKQQQFNIGMAVQAKKYDKTRWNRISLSLQSMNCKNDLREDPSLDGEMM